MIYSHTGRDIAGHLRGTFCLLTGERAAVIGDFEGVGSLPSIRQKKVTLGCGAFYKFSTERRANDPAKSRPPGGAEVYIDRCVTIDSLTLHRLND